MDAPAIGDLAASHGIALHALMPREASLEDVYLDITGESVEYHGEMPGVQGQLAEGVPAR